MATQSDERLLALVREGHERAFETLVNRYRRPLLSYCRRRLALPEARAEDVLQQALLKTWIALRDGAEVRDIKAWLYRVVHNAAVNAVRDSVHDRERLADPTLRAGYGQADLERGLVLREALAEVAALPQLQREVIVRTAVGGDSHEQVASDLGISDGAVRGLLYRARASLRTAATALTPPPLLSWLAGRADQAGPAPERLGELAAGGGAAGLGGLIAKGAVAAVTAGTLLTGAAVVHLQETGHRHRGHARAQAAGGQAASAASTVPVGGASGLVASVRAGGGGRQPNASARGGAATGTRYASLTSSGSATGGTHTGARLGAGVAPRGGGSPRRPGATVPGSAPGGSTQGISTAPVGSTPGGQGQGGSGSSTSGSSGAGAGSGAGATQGEPVGAASGAGSEPGGSGSEAPTGSGGGQHPTGGSGTGSGSEGSGGESGGSGSESGSGGSGSSGGEQSGGLVKTVVHEVGNVLEHLLH